ncbi:MAG TPA: nuclear transport factor 2 family protein [Steroidobacteraceae bacterium]|nr:nuclear transport factor 2 family protein [Steroidobacteraceae bacterium]
MTENKMNGTRRAFFVRGGAVLGAGVATAAAAGVLLPDAAPAVPDRLPQLQRELTSHQDRESIRQLHRAFTAAIENQTYEAAVELFEPHADLNLSGLSVQGQPAIRRLLITQYRQQQARVLHSAYRQGPLQQPDLIAIAADGAHATATFHCDVELSTPLPADSTLAQMARLQGQVAERHWEAGRFEARYVKTDGQWKMTALRFTSSPPSRPQLLP